MTIVEQPDISKARVSYLLRLMPRHSSKTRLQPLRLRSYRPSIVSGEASSYPNSFTRYFFLKELVVIAARQRPLRGQAWDLGLIDEHEMNGVRVAA
jgi:hypothetical protein